MQDKVFRIDDPHAVLTKELLEQEYLQDGLTDKAIAIKHGVGSKVTVWRRRQFYGIPNRCKNKSNTNASVNRKIHITLEQGKEWLAKGQEHQEIADKIGCSKQVVLRRLKELGLVKEQSHVQKKLLWNTELTDQQMRFLMGTMLGDGSITPGGHFQCSHSSKQLAYIKYKRDVLNSIVGPDFEISNNDVFNHQNGKMYKTHHLRTLCNKYLKRIQWAYYIGGKKLFPLGYLLGSNFDSYSLAVWYMDDGGIKSDVALLYTYGFGYSGNLDAAKFLLEKFDIKAYIKEKQEEQRGTDCRHYLVISPPESDKFFQLVAPHLLPMFAYKLPERFRPLMKQIEVSA